MRITDGYKQLKDILKISKNLGMKENVMFRVLDKDTGEVVSEHTGHNSATNSLITGIGHYLVGEGIYNQGYDMLHRYVPLYISLGTMGLLNQEEDEEGLPAGIGVMPDDEDPDDEESKEIYDRWKDLRDKLDLIKGGKQYIDKFGDPEPPLQEDLWIEVSYEDIQEETKSYEYRAYIDSSKYDPDRETYDAAIEEDLDGHYLPRIEYCVYYINMVDSGEVDEHGNMILVPETYYTGEVDEHGEKIYALKWSIAKGLDELDEILSTLRQCPYSEGTCLLHQKCLDCVFPEKKQLIDELQEIKDKWQSEYDDTDEMYQKALEDLEGLKFDKYLDECPGYGSDGSCKSVDSADNNYRPYFGLGPVFENRENTDGLTIDCELISDSFPREMISYRDIVPEGESELKGTVDVVFSAMISTGALKQFREPGRDYVFITEAGLWSSPDWNDSGENGLLAGYRIVPPNSENWAMSASRVKPEDIPPGGTAETVAKHNRQILKENILKVGINQVVQVVWKIQIGGVDQFENMRDIFTVKNYHYAEGMWFGNVPSENPYIPEPPQPHFIGVYDITIKQGDYFNLKYGVHAFDDTGKEVDFVTDPETLDTDQTGTFVINYIIYDEDESGSPSILYEEQRTVTIES